MREKIMPNDVVRHKPSGEKWMVAGVCHENDVLIPMGWPFPSMAKISDCELIEARYEAHPQEESTIYALMEHGLKSCVDARSALMHGIELEGGTADAES